MNALNILGLKIELESCDKVKKVPLYISNHFFYSKSFNKWNLLFVIDAL